MAEVVVTGIGMVTPLGATAAETAAAWRAGRSAARAPLTELRGTPLAQDDVATLPPFDAAARLGGRRMLKYMSHAALLGCLAAREAASEAQIFPRFAPERVGLFAGTGLAAAEVDEVLPMIERSIDAEGELSCRLLGERGLVATNPLLSFKILANMPGCLVSIMEGIKGPSLLFTPREGQTGAALAEAWEAVAAGEVACAVTGASDTPSQPAAFVVLRQQRYLRAGECPAAGAGYLVLERCESAEESGRPILARLRRVGVCASDPTAQVEDPLAERMGRAVAAAPAILLGLACLTGMESAEIIGGDGVSVRFELEAA
jgi:3-oxoacyl-[acyl-carrier-protein] synthase II